ncbi:Serine protease snake [Habropoda laboriosa]|uniref:chymotrypsin n=1 Tax=Habropoda laboriosa TaxID=597456 RepID=A0A0L7R7Y2_9HYME|nr:Serine protease snake [Habropoda laboriosa]
MLLVEGSKCLLENGNAGICKKLPDCSPRMKEVLEGKRHATSTGRCGFDDFEEIVCCPLNITEKIVPRLAEAACQQYDNEITPDDVKALDLSFHIYGGTEAQSGEFPYMVTLGYKNNDTSDDPSPIKYNCGGSLISSQHVLTAAHCANNIHERVPVEVRLGNEDMRNVTNVQRIQISDIMYHPGFKRSTNYNDVAILKLKTQVQLSKTVKPICLQTKSLGIISITPRTPLVAIGWGATSFEDENSKPDKLLKTSGLSLVDKEECDKHYKGHRKLPRGIDDSMICTRDTNSSRRSDACGGDSGGPLLMLTESGDSVIGITAFGQFCGSSAPGVYTSVYHYLDWIEEQVWTGSEQESKEETKTRKEKETKAVKTEFINFTITYE